MSKRSASREIETSKYKLCSMFIHVAGAGPDLVLLHGLPQPPEDFAPLVRVLAASHRVLVVHLPGYGRSAPRSGEYVLSEVGAELASTLRTHHVQRPLLVGCSGGGYRALQLALDHPKLAARGVVQLGPIAGFEDADRARFAATADAVEAGVDLEDALLASMFSRAFVELEPALTRRVVRDMLHAAPHSVIAAELRAFSVAPDLRPRLSELAAPMLLRVGSEDVATPLEHARDVASRCGAKLDVVQGAGHLLHHEDFDGTVEAVRRFDARRP